MQADESRKKMRRRFQGRLLLLIVVLGVLTLFLLTQRVIAPPLATPTPSETALADTPTLIDPIWQTATAIYVDILLPQALTFETQQLTATRTPSFPTIEVGPIDATSVISSATAAALSDRPYARSPEPATAEPASG